MATCGGRCTIICGRRRSPNTTSRASGPDHTGLPDVIFVVNDAELVEQGTHEEWLPMRGVYAGLYKLQTLEVTS